MKLKPIRKQKKKRGLRAGQNLKSNAANHAESNLNAYDELFCCCLVDMEPAVDSNDEESNEVTFIASFMLLSANIEQWLEK